MKKLAITGGVAMGKSTVLRELLMLGVQVASCDKIAREVYQTDRIQSFLLEYAAKMSFTNEVTVDVTREWMLNNADFRSKLEAIMFPEIEAAMLADPSEVVEVPLLFECGLEKHFERTWVVLCSAETQLSRLTARLNSEDQAKKLIALQMPAEEKARRATRVIDTECELIDLVDMIEEIAKEDGLI